MIGLPETMSSSEPLWTRTWRSSRKAIRKMNKAVMRSHHFRIPKYDMPIRLRPVRLSQIGALCPSYPIPASGSCSLLA